jgi:hypothetical protein
LETISDDDDQKRAQGCRRAHHSGDAQRLPGTAMGGEVMRAAELRAVIALVDLLGKPETNVALQSIRKRLAAELEAVIEPAIKAARTKQEAGD